MKTSKKILLLAALVTTFAVGIAGATLRGDDAAKSEVAGDTLVQTYNTAVADILGTVDDGSCDEMVGETADAAYCQSGGWAYAGCCGGSYTRWTRGGYSKCCGTCMR